MSFPSSNPISPPNQNPQSPDPDDEDPQSPSSNPIELEKLWSTHNWQSSWPRKSEIMLEGVIESPQVTEDGKSEDGSSSVGRTKSLTDDDLEELKGCFDLGFGFSYEEIPELCNTLPALELCYSMSRSLDEQCLVPAAGSPGIASWKISSPGDDPEEVKARLKYWAQAVACTVRLCN